ncbi:MAG TPA: BON domain-containing protein, partial [Steroidobacteraceae bacterium]|nr:BON domain-containing protein [Steroidobacteraceae bacterium]
SNGEVTLNGAVDSRQAKRCAEDIADSVSGVRHVQNNLRVRERSGLSSGSSDTSSTLTTGSTTQGRH